MRIINLTDPHFHEGPFRLFGSKLCVLEEALKEPSDLVIIAGDLAHCARLGDEQMSTFRMVSELSRVLNVSKPVILVEGNHDQFGTKGSALDLFHLPNLTKVADRCEYFGFEDTEIVCVPWIRGRSDWKQAVLGFLNNVRGSKKHRLIVGHMNIRDAIQNKNFRVNPDDHFVFSVEELKATAFAPTSLICGHLHERQVLQGINGCYGGAMTQNNFGEDGNPMGYVAWEDGRIEFIDVVAPQFRNINEEDFDGMDSYNNYKFETQQPELYSGFANVKCSKPASDVETKINTTAFDGKVELSQLIGDFCKEAQLEIPQTPRVLEELEKISLSIARTQTGLDMVHSIALEKIGPDKNCLIIEKKFVKFEKGLTAIVGPNGRGKTLLTESVGASLYGKFVRRGALGKYCHGSVTLEVSPTEDNYLIVRNRPAKKGGLDAWVNETYCPKREDLATEIVPLFGPQNVFDSVVFMDQSGKNDLVSAGEAAALEVLAKMLNLSILEEHRKEYAKQAKAHKTRAQGLDVLRGQLELAKEAYQQARLEADDLSCPEHSELESLQKQHKYQLENEKIMKRAKEWTEALQQADEFAVEPEIVKEIQDRKREYWLAKADLEFAEERFNTRLKAGCAPDFLPCHFLSKLTPEEMDVKKARIEANKPREDDELTLRRHETSERARKAAEALWDPIIGKTRIVYEDAAVLALRIQLLEEKQKAWDSAHKRVDEALNKCVMLDLDVQSAEQADRLYQDFAFLEMLCSKKGLSLYVISSIVAGLQKKLDELTAIADIGLRIRVQLSKEGEDSLDQFKIEYSRHGRPYAVASTYASGGEGAMIRVLFKLALMLYLNDYFGSYKVLIMDEPEGGLDAANVEVLLNILRSLKYRLNQIIVVTHDQRIEGIADHVVRFE